MAPVGYFKTNFQGMGLFIYHFSVMEEKQTSLNKIEIDLQVDSKVIAYKKDENHGFTNENG